MNTQSPEYVIALTTAWLEQIVIGLNLCPFAKSVHSKGQIRYVVSKATTSEKLEEELKTELETLNVASSEIIETVLLIHPYVLINFLDYNDFLSIADGLVSQCGLEGILQIASFHPDYQFSNTSSTDIENNTNRSPFPMLHLLREESIERAVRSIPDAADIFEVNITTLQKLGIEKLEQIQKNLLRNI
ncbi:DUF1415 domain-containing protein [Herbaspirillum sp. RTI4]|uniref:DUF1415 domain-containing protein n=1 Tax=Herbaspirillum sp. RTI4 TaxID=3048640 RepID=UPI002AB48CA8|nr:DUF1415 domain-containing protein [Herbaspirillum sp. RTI4]MDY7579891.1 DUF1415 domain-containing protein [Herbaspirillum sp. RTI4]MEA9983568.1 DUF1415 domain-containing protein [Herbaspirillum sp. RTI4]